MVYIVTGAAGFVGSNVIKKLEEQGKTVVALARGEAKIKRALPQTRAKIIYGDVCSVDDVEKLFNVAGEKVILIHCASMVYLGGNREKLTQMRATNIEGTKNIIEACLKYNARLLYVSSVHAITVPKKGIQITVESISAGIHCGRRISGIIIHTFNPYDMGRREFLRCVLSHGIAV